LEWKANLTKEAPSGLPCLLESICLFALNLAVCSAGADALVNETALPQKCNLQYARQPLDLQICNSSRIWHGGLSNSRPGDEAANQQPPKAMPTWRGNAVTTERWSSSDSLSLRLALSQSRLQRSTGRFSAEDRTCSRKRGQCRFSRTQRLKATRQWQVY